ncbi:hypothetical protein LZ32DRAFT_444873 [Colletotrichum eremochloae]|nr:hypothetical protein LZ32DRAFT_444873 [Colletotrichum eremochloae]
MSCICPGTEHEIIRAVVGYYGVRGLRVFRATRWQQLIVIITALIIVVADVSVVSFRLKPTLEGGGVHLAISRSNISA